MQFFLKSKFIFILLAALIMAGCGTMGTNIEKQEFEQADTDEDFPEYDGPIQKIQVITFGVPDNILSKYPELQDKRVGFGLTNRLVETLFDTGRFEFLEEKDVMIRKVVENWTLSESELVDPTAELEKKGLQLPKYLVYAEVYDFAVSKSETVAGVIASESNNTLVGIQVRFVDVSTGIFIPGSGLGESSTNSAGIWVTPDLAFDQTTVGQASQVALNIAVRNVLKRMDKQNQ